MRGALDRLLVEPVVHVPGADDRRRARLLALLSLSQALVASTGGVHAALFVPSPLAEVVAPAIAVTALSYALGYALARRGRWRAAAAVSIALQIGVPMSIMVLAPRTDVDAMSAAAWASIALLTANTALGATRVVAVGVAASFASVVSLLAVGAPTGEISEAALYLCAITAIVYVYARHRDGLEAARRAQLSARNADLEQLRATLEERVEHRTHELERALEQVHASHETLLQTEKMAAVGRLTAGFAHELATPLSALVCSLDELETLGREYARSIGDDDVTPEDHRAIAAEMATATQLAKTAGQRAVMFVKGIRAHTRDSGPRSIERFDASGVVSEAVELLAHVARAADVEVVVRSSGDAIPICGVPSRLNQAVTNLVQNAVYASGEHRPCGTVTVAIAARGDRATIEVEDDGPGVPEEIRDKIFEPLFTTKPYGKGTGLGLAIVREIVCDELGGELAIGRSAAGGARFTMSVPMAEGGSHGA